MRRQEVQFVKLASGYNNGIFFIKVLLYADKVPFRMLYFEGFDALCVDGILSRQVYISHIMRQPYVA